jgi:hypothetical protein
MRERIEALRLDAREAGDEKQAALCDAALAGDVNAWDQCVQIIHEQTRILSEMIAQLKGLPPESIQHRALMRARFGGSFTDKIFDVACSIVERGREDA